jgi:hypothetical protein
MTFKTIEVNGFTVPASKKDAIKKMIEGIENGAIRPEANCVNKNDAGEMCIIGYMFTEEQLRTIKNDGENSSSVGALTWRYGDDNIKAMLGMKRQDAMFIQYHFDLVAKEFMENGGDYEVFKSDLIKFLKAQAKK